MRGNVLRERLRSSRGLRLAIVVFAVPAILVGLLALHVLTTVGLNDVGTSLCSGTHHDGSASVQHMAATMAASTMPSHSPSGQPEGCGGMCAPGHEMLEMICVLALLVTAVLFTLQLILTGWQPFKRVAAAITATTAALAVRPAPSLHVLSVSRT